MAYRDYVSELVGTIPHLPFPLAQKLINRAWKDLRDLRPWSFLVSTGDLVTPSLISAGSVTVAQGSLTVVCDPIATAALSPVALANPPLSSPLLGAGRQIRVGLTGSAGPVYSIVGWDGTDPNAGVITLDRPYLHPDGAAQPYQVYKAYYGAPDTDFLRYVAVTNTRAGYTIRGKNLYVTQEKLNAIDPQRGGTGDAYRIASFRPDSSGRPVHEWYPHPTNFTIYNAVYRKRGAELSLTVDLPATFPDSLLMARAFQHAADWAVANVAVYPALAGTNWIMFKQSKGELVKEELVQAIKQDDEISPLAPWIQGSFADFPLGGEFLQSHDVSSLIGG